MLPPLTILERSAQLPPIVVAKRSKRTFDPKAAKRELFERGWSQARLAQYLGCSTNAVCGAINHGEYPNIVSKVKIELNL